MELRTPIEIPKQRSLTISHDDHIVMLGSCFTDNVGSLLERDGFDVTHNPMGALYNAASINSAIRLALLPDARKDLQLKEDEAGKTHCLDFASKYANADKELLISDINQQLDTLRAKIQEASVIMLTLGTAYVFSTQGKIVGNCHKFAPSTFERTRLDVDGVAEHLKSAIEILPETANIVLTVSPIRHTADGLHGNQLSKAILQLAVDRVADGQRIHYFPAYEILMDDLRDYRFYADDMKHPSTVAIEYIYQTLQAYYFTPATIQQAQNARKQALRQAHRQILP